MNINSESLNVSKDNKQLNSGCQGLELERERILCELEER